MRRGRGLNARAHSPAQPLPARLLCSVSVPALVRPETLGIVPIWRSPALASEEPCNEGGTRKKEKALPRLDSFLPRQRSYRPSSGWIRFVTKGIVLQKVEALVSKFSESSSAITSTKHGR